MKEIAKLLFYDIKSNVDDNVDTSFVGVVIINLLIWNGAIMLIAPLRVHIYDYLYSFTFLRNIYDLNIAILIYIFIVIVTISFQITIILDKNFKKVDSELKRKQCELDILDNVLANDDEEHIEMAIDELENMLTNMDISSMEQRSISLDKILNSKFYKIIFLIITILILSLMIFFDLANRKGEMFSILGRYTVKINLFPLSLAIVIYVIVFKLILKLNKKITDKSKLLLKVSEVDAKIIKRKLEIVKAAKSSLSSVEDI